MKKKFLSSWALSLFALMVSGTLLFSSCQNRNSSKISLQKTLLSGSNEVPSVSTSGKGDISGSYDTSSMKLHLTITWALGNPEDSTIGIHIHHAKVGVNGSVILPFSKYYPTGSSGSFTTTTRALTNTEQGELKTGELYLNIHSPTHPPGELRGQLMLK